MEAGTPGERSGLGPGERRWGVMDRDPEEANSELAWSRQVVDH